VLSRKPVARSFVIAAYLLAATCTPFEAGDSGSDSGVSDSGAGDSGVAGDSGAVDGGAEGSVPGDAGSAVLVRAVANTATSNTKLIVEFPTAPADGHTLILVIGSDGTYPLSVTGAGAASWVDAAKEGTHISTQIWVAVGVINATPDVTITWSNGVKAVGILTEWAGLSAFDSAGNTSEGSSTTALVTPFNAQAGQLLFAAAGTQSLASNPTDGFSAIDAPATNGSVGVVAAYLSVGAAGTYKTSWTKATTNGWDTMLIALH